LEPPVQSALYSGFRLEIPPDATPGFNQLGENGSFCGHCLLLCFPAFPRLAKILFVIFVAFRFLISDKGGSNFLHV